MVPAEGGLVDFRKSKASTLIGVFDMLQSISVMSGEMRMLVTTNSKVTETSS